MKFAKIVVGGSAALLLGATGLLAGCEDPNAEPTQQPSIQEQPGVGEQPPLSEPGQDEAAGEADGGEGGRNGY